MTDKKIQVKSQNILYDLDKSSFYEIIEDLAETLVQSDNVSNRQDFIDTIIAREEAISTSIGNLIAIPHGKSSAVKESSIAMAKLKAPIKWEGESEGLVQFVFLLAIAEADKGNQHLKTLANLSEMLMDEDYIDGIKQSQNKEELYQAINI